FFHRWARTPVATEVHARPNRKADTDCSQCSTKPTEGEGWCKERMREEHCSQGTSAAAKAYGGKDDDRRSRQAQHPVALPERSIASTLHIALHEESTDTPHKQKGCPAHEDDSIGAHHGRRRDLQSLHHRAMFRYDETGGSIVAPRCLKWPRRQA